MGDIPDTDYSQLHHHISHQTSLTFCTVRLVISQTLTTATSSHLTPDRSYLLYSTVGDIPDTVYSQLHHHISHQTSLTFCTVRLVISQTLTTATSSHLTPDRSYLLYSTVGDIPDTVYSQLHHHISHQTSLTFCTVRLVISQTLTTATSSHLTPDRSYLLYSTVSDIPDTDYS